MPKVVDHAERRDEIALVACRVVAAYGFERASMARIAREAGYTTGMLAHYFDSKQDIIIAAKSEQAVQSGTEGERAGDEEKAGERYR